MSVLQSNRLASRCATEDNVSYCCAGRCVIRFRPDVKPKPFDHRDETQQFEICSKTRDGFIAKPVVPHTFPPTFLRFGFLVLVRNKRVYHLEDDAKGLTNRSGQGSRNSVLGRI
ncbi:hypothetical protein V6N11_031217 [Hibiscus sabdariffa]|uniref:Uncharacterized protein n=1 Tax=Hibiscus sabdariffa TaxID=183260 RepID=A0ABR2AGE6_9ROSI